MRNSLKKFTVLLVLAFAVSSCATLSPNGVGRVRHYKIESEQLPQSFEGYQIAFISDIHYPSLFTRGRLAKITEKLQRTAPDILLLGGDYVTSGSYIEELFNSISSVNTTDGIYAVYGNHERRNKEQIAQSMLSHNITLLKDSVVGIERGDEKIYIAGIYDSFEYSPSLIQPAECVPDTAFTILLCHTPDYAERSSTTADLTLSGHTHGGQVSLLGIYTPVKNTSYGRRFLKGKNRTSSGATVITTTGVGTSRKKIRFCVPSELVLIRLHRTKNNKKP